MATRPRGFQRRSPSRIRDWGLGPAAAQVALNTSGKVLWTDGTTPAQNLTVIRTRGIVTVHMLTASAALSGFKGAHGIYMMTEDAFAVGVTAALDPMADANSDMWLWHSFFDCRQLTTTLSDGANAFSAVSRITIDSKAMRKNFDPERVMVGVTGVVEQGTATAQVHADSRQLFLS